jgi:lauroyl/myristoyl acyltransferase
LRFQYCAFSDVPILFATMKPPSHLWNLHLRLAYAALRAITGLARLLPLRMAVSWSAALWRILAPRLNPKRHRMALENLSIAFPEKSGQERLAICLAHWEILAASLSKQCRLIACSLILRASISLIGTSLPATATSLDLRSA